MSQASFEPFRQHLTSPDASKTAPAIVTAPRPVVGIERLVHCLGAQECRRRLLHMVPGLLPLILLFVPHLDPWGLPITIGVLTLITTVMVVAILRHNDFARPNETAWSSSVLGYGLPVIVMLLAFPHHAQLAMLTVGILAFGDGSATLGGKLLGRRRLPWNPSKTWAGMTCFVIGGSMVGSLDYWLESNPGVSYGTALIIAAVAAAFCSIVESLPIRSHDNLRVGITAGLCGLAMHVMLLGW